MFKLIPVFGQDNTYYLASEEEDYCYGVVHLRGYPRGMAITDINFIVR